MVETHPVERLAQVIGRLVDVDALVHDESLERDCGVRVLLLLDEQDRLIERFPRRTGRRCGHRRRGVPGRRRWRILFGFLRLRLGRRSQREQYSHEKGRRGTHGSGSYSNSCSNDVGKKPATMKPRISRFCTSAVLLRVSTKM